MTNHDLKKIQTLLADAAKQIERLEKFVDFVNLWCSRANLTPAERINVIQYHPVARDRMKGGDVVNV